MSDDSNNKEPGNIEVLSSLVTYKLLNQSDLKRVIIPQDVQVCLIKEVFIQQLKFSTPEQLKHLTLCGSSRMSKQEIDFTLPQCLITLTLQNICVEQLLIPQSVENMNLINVIANQVFILQDANISRLNLIGLYLIKDSSQIINFIQNGTSLTYLNIFRVNLKYLVISQSLIYVYLKEVKGNILFSECSQIQQLSLTSCQTQNLLIPNSVNTLILLDTLLNNLIIQQQNSIYDFTFEQAYNINSRGIIEQIQFFMRFNTKLNKICLSNIKFTDLQIPKYIFKCFLNNLRCEILNILSENLTNISLVEVYVVYFSDYNEQLSSSLCQSNQLSQLQIGSVQPDKDELATRFIANNYKQISQLELNLQQSIQDTVCLKELYLSNISVNMLIIQQSIQILVLDNVKINYLTLNNYTSCQKLHLNTSNVIICNFMEFLFNSNQDIEIVLQNFRVNQFLLPRKLKTILLINCFTNFITVARDGGYFQYRVLADTATVDLQNDITRAVENEVLQHPVRLTFPTHLAAYVTLRTQKQQAVARIQNFLAQSEFIPD